MQRTLSSGHMFGIFFVVGMFLGASYLSATYSDTLYAIVSFEGALGVVVYIALTAGAIVVAPFSTLPLIPVASHMWGWGYAALFSIIGWVVGSQIAFFLARKWGRPLVGRLISLDSFDRLEHRFPQERMWWSVLFLRMTVPVDILSYALGLFSHISSRDFFLTTLIGVTPFAFVFAYVGTLSLYAQLFVLIEVVSVIITFHVVQGTQALKRSLLAIALVSTSVLAWYFRATVLKELHMVTDIAHGNIFLIALILIMLKTISAPIGFPGTPLTLLAGALLGPIFGTITALVGNTIGASLAFLASRYVLQEVAQQKLRTTHPKVREYESRLESRPFATIIFLRLIPLFPFNVLNFLLGVTRVRLGVYMFASFVGMIPGTFIFVFFGDSLRALNPVSIALSVVGLVALIIIGKKYGNT